MLLDALNGVNHQSRPPVWLMRQAGRSLPAFRKIRAEHSFWKCLFTPDLATEITLLPEKELGVDALILFSDILVIYEKFRGNVVFPGGRPYVECSFQDEVGIEVFNPIFETIRQVKQKTNLPLIGFAGGPLTVLSYLQEKPDHKLLEKITRATREYIEKQIEAGVSAIQIFDSWAGAKGLQEMEEFTFPYVKEIMKDLPVPTIFFSRYSSQFAKEIVKEINPTAIGLDSSRSIKEVRAEVGDKITLQGNLDPNILLKSPKEIEEAVKVILEDRRGDPAYIFNLGHGVLPETPVEHVRLLINTISA